MLLSMARAFVVVLLSLTPVVEEEVVEQAASGCCLIIHPQCLADAEGEVGNASGMVVDMIGVMPVLLEFEELVVLQDILDQQCMLGSQQVRSRTLNGIGEEQGEKGEKQEEQFNGELVENAHYTKKS